MLLPKGVNVASSGVPVLSYVVNLVELPASFAMLFSSMTPETLRSIAERSGGIKSTKICIPFTNPGFAIPQFIKRLLNDGMDYLTPF